MPFQRRKCCPCLCSLSPLFTLQLLQFSILTNKCLIIADPSVKKMFVQFNVQTKKEIQLKLDVSVCF